MHVCVFAHVCVCEELSNSLRFVYSLSNYLFVKSHSRPNSTKTRVLSALELECFIFLFFSQATVFILPSSRQSEKRVNVG